MAHRVVLRPDAVADLKSIFTYVAEQAGFDAAARYDRRLRDACGTLADFPNRGTPREDLAPGLRSIPFERRATIYYVVEREAVRIVRILHAGRDPGREFAGARGPQ